MRKLSKKQEDIGLIVDAIRKIRSAIDSHSKELMKSFHITGPQLGALFIVDRYPGITLGELSRRLYLHVSTVSGIVDRLKKSGYLSRDRDTRDRRTIFLKLTPKGEKLIKQAPISGFGLIVIGLNKIPGREVEKINQSMKTLVGLISEDGGTERTKTTFRNQFKSK